MSKRKYTKQILALVEQYCKSARAKAERQDWASVLRIAEDIEVEISILKEGMNSHETPKER